MRSEPSIQELIFSIIDFFKALDPKKFNDIRDYIDLLEVNSINENKINKVIDYINNKLIGNLISHDRFYAFVARNSLQIIIREINLINNFEEKENIRLESLLKKKGNTRELNKILCERIKTRQIDRKDCELKEHLIKTTMAKLAIDQPNYSGYLKALKDKYPKD